MFKQPYDTTMGARAPITKIKNELISQFLLGELHSVPMKGSTKDRHSRSDHDEDALAIYEIPVDDKHVVALYAPVVIDTTDGPVTVIDTRPYMRRSREGVDVIADGLNYRALVREAVLTDVWYRENGQGFSSLGPIPLRVFSRWIADGVARRLALTPADQLRVSCVAAYYYLCLMREESDPEDAERDLLGRVNVISRALNLPANYVHDTLVNLSHLNSLEDFVSALKATPELSLRMESMSPAIIYTLLGGSWFGARKRFNVEAALEFPPSFLTMLYTAYTDRSYHSCYLAKLAVQADRRQESLEFILAMNNLTRGYV